MCFIENDIHADWFFCQYIPKSVHVRSLTLVIQHCLIAFGMAESHASTSLNEKESTPGSETGQNTQLVEQVFSMFKGYVTSQLEAKDKHLHEESKIVKESKELKFKVAPLLKIRDFLIWI